MKKTLFLAAAVLAFSAQADYIYWMVENNPVNGYNWDTAYLKQQNGDTVVQLGELTWTAAQGYLEDDAYAYSALGANYTEASFFIELWKDSKFAAQSDSQTYAQVKSNIFGSNMMNPSIAAGSGFMPSGSTYNVPEPTSGLLFLVGGMLLGLKRRRQQV